MNEIFSWLSHYLFNNDKIEILMPIFNQYEKGEG